MKWIGRSQSDNVEDRRGMSTGGKTVLGGGIIGIVILLLQTFGGENAQILTPVLEQFNQNGAPTEQRALTAEEEKIGEFPKVVFKDTEDIWTKIFEENNMQYKKPILVLFTGSVESACGGASSASGPFYCPEDQKVYMDLAFFDELQTKFGASGGDFATAYVIAHEVGHHIQTLLGTSDKMRQAQQGKSEADANKLSVALELQADFYAGVWAKYNQENLDIGDIDEALSAAQAVGDDAIQKRMQGHVVPESFTHEVGHHIQTLLGTSDKMRQAQQGKSEAEANKLSVALELQADFYAGVWAKYNQENLDIGDIDEALSAAQAVGDDAIQKRMQGHVVPESFTHGTSEQRKHWFMKGYTTGDIKQGNTFSQID